MEIYGKCCAKTAKKKCKWLTVIVVIVMCVVSAKSCMNRLKTRHRAEYKETLAITKAHMRDTCGNWRYSVETDAFANKTYCVATCKGFGTAFDGTKIDAAIILRRGGGFPDIYLYTEYPLNLNADNVILLKTKDSEPDEIATYDIQNDYWSGREGMVGITFANYSEIFDLLKGGEQIMLQCPIYNKGKVEFKFNPAGFKWKH